MRSFGLSLGLFATAALSCAFSLGCSESSEDSSAGFGGDTGSGAMGFGATGAVGSGIGGSFVGTGGTSGEPPPEEELEITFEAPVVTGRLLWSANPDSGRVALVDVDTLTVRSLEAGLGPATVAAVPGSTAALVLNAASFDATLFRLDGSAVTTATLPTHERAQQLAVSTSGKWAIAWSDARLELSPDPAEGYQTLTILDLESSVARQVSVGWRPSGITFAPNASRAYVVSEPGIEVLDLEQGQVEQLIPVGDPLTVVGRDVSITSDTKVALVRYEGQATISIIDLATQEQVDLEMPSPVTDLDLSPDGSVALAVMRASSQVAYLPLVTILTAPESMQIVDVEDQVFGSASLSSDGLSSVLFTNAVANPLATVLLGGATPSFRTVDLKAPVQAAFVSLDGAHAITVQQPAEGSTRQGAFSLIPLALERSPKIVGTDAPIEQVAISADGDRALVTVGTNVENAAAYLIKLPSLETTQYRLASVPLAAGLVSGKAWVAQVHPEGRLTVIDVTSGAARTLTGFELASKVYE